jgi:hypothetical protein
VVKGRPLNLFNTVHWDVKLILEMALYINPEQDRLRSHIEKQARLVRLRVGESSIWRMVQTVELSWSKESILGRV